ncbi:MAG: hypothetical protein V4521_13055, partial [Pseudomonadota bacterium]
MFSPSKMRSGQQEERGRSSDFAPLNAEKPLNPVKSCDRPAGQAAHIERQPIPQNLSPTLIRQRLMRNREAAMQLCRPSQTFRVRD